MPWEVGFGVKKEKFLPVLAALSLVFYFNNSSIPFLGNRFVKTPGTIRVLEGSSARFEWTWSIDPGRSIILISWCKWNVTSCFLPQIMGFSGGRLSVTPNSPFASRTQAISPGTMLISGLRESDSGKYRCEIILDSFITVTNFAILVVLGKYFSNFSLRGGGLRLDLGFLKTPQNTAFIAGEPQKLDRQKYIVYHWNRLFVSFSKIQLSDTLEILVKLHPDYSVTTE